MLYCIYKSYVYWTVHHCDSSRIKDQLDVTCYLFHFLCAQHVLDINISIIRSLQLFCWITTLVVLFLVWCVLEFRCGWVGVVSMLQAEAQLQFQYGWVRLGWSGIHVAGWSTTYASVSVWLGWVGLGWSGNHVAGWSTTSVSVWLGWVGVVSMLQAEAQVVLQPTTRIPLQPNHTETPTHIEPRTVRPMW